MFGANEIDEIISICEGNNAEFKLFVPSKVSEQNEVVCAFVNNLVSDGQNE